MKRRDENGITLIALIITIIIMLILAGVALALVVGNNGLIKLSKDARNETNMQAAIEKINLKITNSQMNSYGRNQNELTLQDLANDFCEDEEIEYVELNSKKLASLSKIEIGKNKSFFTKLKEYPYEFEINGSLQLASIDGVNISKEENDYSNKNYSSEGLSVYSNRVEIINGGYYTDGDGVTWVNITFKALQNMGNANGVTEYWLIYDLPTPKESFIVMDMDKNYAFKILNYSSYPGSVVYFDTRR